LLVVAGLFLGWIAVSSSWGNSSSQSFKEVAKWAQFAVALLITMDLARRPADLKPVAVVSGLLVGSEALISSVMAILGIGPESFRVGGIVRAFGTFEQPNPFAGYLALHLPFAVAGFMVWRGRLRGAAFLISLLVLSGLIFSLSRGGWIAASLGLLAVLWMLPIKVPRIFIRSLFVIGFFVALLLLWRGNSIFPSETSSIFSGETEFVTLVTKHSEANFAVKQRLAFWVAGIRMVTDHPLTGVGIGNYAARYPDYKIGPWTESIGHAHNLYIHLAAETGLIGLGLFVVFLTWLIVHVIGSRSIADSDQVMLAGATGSIVAFSTHNIVDSLFVGGLGIMFGVIVGLALGVRSITTSAQYNI
jgi:O-antigen ligase